MTAVSVRPFVPEDIERLSLQPSQSYLREFILHPNYGKALAQGDAWTAEREDGTIVGCAGIVMVGLHGNAWAMLAHDAGDNFFRIHRAVKRGLEACTARRVEMHVDVDFTEGHRWARLLGFEREGHLRCWLPDGRDVILYARVKHV